MISAFLRGGLGNQMFQIATTIAVATDNGDRYAFPFDNPVAMQGNVASTYKHNVYSKLREITPLWKPQTIWKENNEPYHPIVYSDNMLLDGYFQTEKYFKDYKDLIVDIFTHKSTTQKLKEQYDAILQNSVAIHVRRGDYVKIGECLDLSYYYKALNLLWQTVDFKDILVFSDDIKWCRENFLTHDKRVTYIDDLKDYERMYLTGLCPYIICANSSYAWWGAYLNQNPQKLVYMPKPWTTSICDDIYPEGAIIIEYLK